MKLFTALTAGVIAGLTATITFALYSGWKESNQAHWQLQQYTNQLKKEICGTEMEQHLPKDSEIKCN